MSSINAQPAPTVLTPVQNGTYPKRVKFSGKGLAGWLVIFDRVPFDGTEYGTATVDQNQNWEFEVELEPDMHRTRAYQTINRERSDNTPIIDFQVL